MHGVCVWQTTVEGKISRVVCAVYISITTFVTHSSIRYMRTHTCLSPSSLLKIKPRIMHGWVMQLCLFWGIPYEVGAHYSVTPKFHVCGQNEIVCAVYLSLLTLIDRVAWARENQFWVSEPGRSARYTIAFCAEHIWCKLHTCKPYFWSLITDLKLVCKRSKFPVEYSGTLCIHIVCGDGMLVNWRRNLQTRQDEGSWFDNSWRGCRVPWQWVHAC